MTKTVTFTMEEPKFVIKDQNRIPPFILGKTVSFKVIKGDISLWFIDSNLVSEAKPYFMGKGRKNMALKNYLDMYIQSNDAVVEFEWS